MIRQGFWLYGNNSLIQPVERNLPLNIVHPEVQRCFLRCFNDGHQNPNLRPSAGEWKQALKTAFNSLNLCGKVDSHYYSHSYGKCYWCDRATKLGVDIFPGNVTRQTPPPPPPPPLPNQHRQERVSQNLPPQSSENTNSVSSSANQLNTQNSLNNFWGCIGVGIGCLICMICCVFFAFCTFAIVKNVPSGWSFFFLIYYGVFMVLAIWKIYDSLVNLLSQYQDNKRAPNLLSHRVGNKRTPIPNKHQ
ncbi:MAG: hypothetical protein QNJ47_19985 [Nostocaceae cyanobacterium]|nr:hypothetical protein [Nostocaceae cyanobacterium]